MIQSNFFFQRPSLLVILVAKAYSTVSYCIVAEQGDPLQLEVTGPKAPTEGRGLKLQR